MYRITEQHLVGEVYEVVAHYDLMSIVMCNYSDFVWNRGKREGIREGKIEDFVNLMSSLKLTIDQALQALKLHDSEWDEYRDLVRKHGAHPAQ